MRAAVIDMGTNTFHLIIADLSATGFEVIYKTNVPVKLGEGRLNDDVIIPAAFERAINTLKDFSQTITDHQVALVKATATSAVRNATNKQEFMEAAKMQAGIEIEVISGDDEAAFIYHGVQATGVLSTTSLIMDIGGGSTEFIICTPEQVLWKKSYDLGAARLLQAYFKSDPISADDQANINNRLESELKDLKEACTLYAPDTLIGSAGAFETFAGLLNKQLDLENTPYAIIDLISYRHLAAKLLLSSHEERVDIEGLIPLRVDLIVIAAMITNHIIDTIGIKSMYLSAYDLKMGVLHTLRKP